MGVTFIFIAAITYNHISTNSVISDKTTQVIIDSSLTDAEKINSLNNLRKDTDTSNLTFYNIILPMVATWVGAIIAFYFTSDASNKERAALQDAHKEQLHFLRKNLSIKNHKTMAELLALYEHRKNPITASLDEKISEVITKANRHDNVVLVKQTKPNGEPYLKSEILGVLYLGDILDAKAKSGSKPTPFDEQKLQDEIGNILDRVLQKNWTKEGLQNYAALKYFTTDSEAIETMNSFNNSHVRGIIFDDKDIMIGIINFKTLLLLDDEK